MVLPVFHRLYCVYRTPGTLVKMQTLIQSVCISNKLPDDPKWSGVPPPSEYSAKEAVSLPYRWENKL